MKKHDVPSLILIALVACLPLVASAPATYGLTSVVGAWVGLASVAVGAVAGIWLNQRERIGDDE